MAHNLKELLKQLHQQRPLTPFDVAAIELECNASKEECERLEAAYQELLEPVR